MPLEIVRNDITKMRVDAIVNAANRSLLGGGGVDGAIHRAAGPELLAECRGLGGCETGEAKLTRGYRLPAKYVIHTVGPIWRGGAHGERALLAACYRNSLRLAHESGCETVAFPLISADAYGYPKDQAMAVAVESVAQFLLDHDMTVYLVVFGRAELITGKKLFRDVQEYIDDVYVDAHADSRAERSRRALWQADAAAALRMDEALELSLPETRRLLEKAGFALSHSSKFDIILEYFIKSRSYDIYEINEVLFQFDMPLLGSGFNQ